MLSLLSIFCISFLPSKCILFCDLHRYHFHRDLHWLDFTSINTFYTPWFENSQTSNPPFPSAFLLPSPLLTNSIPQPPFSLLSLLGKITSLPFPPITINRQEYESTHQENCMWKNTSRTWTVLSPRLSSV